MKRKQRERRGYFLLGEKWMKVVCIGMTALLFTSCGSKEQEPETYTEIYSSGAAIWTIYSDKKPEESSDSNLPSTAVERGIFLEAMEQAGVTDFLIDWQDENLKQAMIEITQISDGEIRLSDVWGMTDLDLHGKGIKNIEALKELVHLKVLNLSGNEITDITALKYLTDLEYLHLDKNNISDIDAVSSLENLKKLSLRENKISSIQSLEDLLNLHSLNLNDNQISEAAEVEVLDNFNGIYSLDGNPVCEQMERPDFGVALPWEKAGQEDRTIDWQDENLKAAMIEVTGITDREICLSDIWNITELDLREREIKQITALGDCYNLKSLNLSNNQISDITALLKLSQLKRLSLSENEITDITVLLKLSELKELSLSGNKITDFTALEVLGKLKSLSLDNLKENGPAAAEKLKFLPKLQKL